jgi:hypothetical protein
VTTALKAAEPTRYPDTSVVYLSGIVGLGAHRWQGLEQPAQTQPARARVATFLKSGTLATVNDTSPGTRRKPREMVRLLLRAEVPMRTVFWSAKGGSGVTVTAAALALATPDCLLVDLCGDTALALGVDEPPVGLFAWLHSAHEVDASALDRLIITVRPGFALLPAGTTRPALPANASIVAERFAVLLSYLAAKCPTGPQSSAQGSTKLSNKQRALTNISRSFELRTPASTTNEMQWSNVIVDAGTPSQIGTTAFDQLLNGVDRSLLVVRSCFLAVHASVELAHRAHGVVVVSDEERRITDADVAAAIGLPVFASIFVQPAVARAVDAGLLSARLPRIFTRSLEALQPVTEPARSQRRILQRVQVAS